MSSVGIARTYSRRALSAALSAALAVSMTPLLPVTSAAAASLEAPSESTASSTASSTADLTAGVDYVAGELIVVLDGDVDTAREERLVAERLARRDIEVDSDIVSAAESDGSEAVVLATYDEGECDIDEAADMAASVSGVARVQPNYIYDVEDTDADDGSTDDGSTSDGSTASGSSEGSSSAGSVSSDSASALTAAVAAGAQYYLYGDTGSTVGADVEDAWDTVTCDGAVTVATIDTGIDLTHEDLADNILTDYCYDFINGTRLKSTISGHGDPDGHGTQVAGIISGVADNDLGMRGVSHDANLIAVRAVNTSSYGTTYSFASALNYVSSIATRYPDLNLRVVNMSVGSYSFGLDWTLRYAFSNATDAGLVVVCAGGNGDGDSTPYTTGFYPSDYADALSVTALSTDGTNAAWSDFNAAKDLSAPGVSIYTTDKNSDYTWMSGTSASSPIVAGIAALLFALDPDADLEDVREALTETATEIDDSSDPYARNSTGYDGVVSGSAGAVNAEAAVAYLAALATDDDLSAAEVALSESSYVYDGTACEPSVTVTLGGSVLEEGTDYEVSYADNTCAGEASATVSGIGDWTGTATVTFEIARAELSVVSVDAESLTYCGSALEPDCTVLDACGNVVSEDAYGLSWSSNTDAGTATVTATATDTANYVEGSVSSTFSIGAANIASADVSVAADGLVYDGSAQTPEVTVTCGATVLSEGCDYSLSWSSNTDAGTAAVTVVGEGNYCSSATATFVISPCPLSTCAMALAWTSRTYDGTAQVPTATVTSSGGSVLASGSDYALQTSPATCVNAGTYALTASGCGNYTGTIQKSFAITRAGQSLTVKTPSKSVKRSKVKKKAQTVSGAVKVSGASGTVAYKKLSGSSKLSIDSSSGEVTVKKGAPKGKLSIKVRVSAAATANRTAATKTVTVTVTVK